MRFTKVLFLSWDGPEVTYLENLFAPIFIKLKERYGYEFHIIQFTSAKQEKIKQRKEDLATKGIHYLGIPSSQKSALWGMLKAKFLDIYRVKKYAKKHGIEVVMPRAVNAYFIVKALCQNQKFRFVWDADGFPLEERVDFAGLSKKTWRYQFFKNMEHQAYHQAASLLCRTQKAKEIIVQNGGEGFDKDKVFVVNNGTFVPIENHPSVVKPKQLTLVYAGSKGPQYLLAEMLETFQIIKKAFPDARFKILTFQIGQVQNYIQQHYPQLFSSVEIKSVPAGQVKEELTKAHIGISFRKPSFSMQGVAPIKVVEYLSAGLPLIYNPGIGDLDELLGTQEFTYSLDTMKAVDAESLVPWIQKLMDQDRRDQVIQFAEEHFSLERSAALYHQALQYGEG
ncbi:hypothetical protein [Cecembia rubra]|uniref:Glycosyltransferase involved in cell wall biosynthesis n=1 Tax=Cecembia rubra TaxID=1485585 RepID=A0A2P8DVM4_9BACT|nr:hypothetical protein [Cecembia rubra]PSL01254.1 glycosyltransferase involved in cell wall biosynthesis [Cecembia rubra]